MKSTLIEFYTSFFGLEFARHFKRPSDFKLSRIQFTVTNPKQLYTYVHKNSGYHPCYASVYDYCTVDQLKHNKQNMAYFDRAHFDFDISNSKVKNLKKDLVKLRSNGLNHKVTEQNKIKLQLKELIINEQVAKPAIDECKRFAEMFKHSFGKYPALFFSGFKGCHAYSFFDPIELIKPNKTIEHFAGKVKALYNLETMDLSVNKNALSRVARLPFSKHQLTDLTVVPFKITDSYDEIISKSLKPIIKSYNIENYTTKFNEHLNRIDKILENNHQLELKQKVKPNKYFTGKHTPNAPMDHRIFFMNILGKPDSEYSEKEYVMYRCPFNDHHDNKPSFRVHKTGYTCYGCDRKGNYWQFLKDYNDWDDNQVRMHLKSTQT